jgi:hypothetical protein
MQKGKALKHVSCNADSVFSKVQKLQPFQTTNISGAEPVTRHFLSNQCPKHSLVLQKRLLCQGKTVTASQHGGVEITGDYNPHLAYVLLKVMSPPTASQTRRKPFPLVTPNLSEQRSGRPDFKQPSQPFKGRRLSTT